MASAPALRGRDICSKRTTAHRCDGFVECRENPHLADSRCDAVSVHVGPKVWTDTCENDADALARQIFEQIAYGLRGGVVYICDRACINDEPVDRQSARTPRGRALRGQSG